MQDISEYKIFLFSVRDSCEKLFTKAVKKVCYMIFKLSAEFKIIIRLYWEKIS